MSLNSNTRPVVNYVIGVGEVVDTHLTFHSHIDKIVAREFIRKNFSNILFRVTSQPNTSIYGTCSIQTRIN